MAKNFVKTMKNGLSFIIYHTFIISGTPYQSLTYEEMTNETPKTKNSGNNHSMNFNSCHGVLCSYCHLYGLTYDEVLIEAGAS